MRKAPKAGAEAKKKSPQLETKPNDRPRSSRVTMLSPLGVGATGAPLGIPYGSEALELLPRLGSGRPLDFATRFRLRPALGEATDAARIHDDGSAANIASAFGARAIAIGDHVAFAHGQYRPGTIAGDALIAHELAHFSQASALSSTQAEHDANTRAASVFGNAPPSPMPLAPTRGLALRGCVQPHVSGPPEVELANLIVERLDGEADAESMLDDMNGAPAELRAALPRAIELLRLRAHSEHTNYYRFLISYLRANLSGSRWAEAERLLSLDPTVGTEAVALSEEGRTLLRVLRSPRPSHIPTMRAPSAEDSAAGVVIAALHRSERTQIGPVITVLHRTPDATYGNQLFRLSAEMRRTGTAEQYREFVRILHSEAGAAALDERDLALQPLVERQTFLNREGTPSELTDAQMAGLFATRGLEVALQMLRDSEAQLLSVLDRTRGEGGDEASLDADADAAIAVLDRHFQPPMPEFRPFADFATRIRAAASAQGRSFSDDVLRRYYNRTRQILTYRFGAARERLVVEELARLRRTIREEREWLEGPHIIHENFILGPGEAGMRAQAEQERINRRARGVARMEARVEELVTIQNDVERVLPLLGGMDADQLTSLSSITNPEEIDQIVERRLATIFGNIEEARRLLLSGEVRIWLLPPVVDATKRALGIEGDGANATQQRWVRVINAQIDSARSDEESTRRILEILNAAALIASIGLAIFTGGGSLALYAGLGLGVASIGLSIGTSIYDVSRAAEGVREAEALHGSALTAGTRLSEVPPDYHHLHLAWVSLGVNVAISVLMLRSLGSQAATLLRGEEAAVRQQARLIVQRLRAAGATESEEELLEATMQALRNRGWVAGATRGTDIYRLRPSVRLRAGVAANGERGTLEQQIDGLLGEARLEGATLTRGNPPPVRPRVEPAPGSPVPAAPPAIRRTPYFLEVPKPGGGTTRVRIEFDAAPDAMMPPGAHGAESGPARLQLVADDADSWHAIVTVNERLAEADVAAVVGHELDEIAALVNRLPTTASSAAIEAEMTARIFRPGAIAAGTIPSAHDLAQIAELRRLIAQLRPPPGVAPPNITQRTMLEARLEQMYRSMGMRDPVGIAERAAALRAGTSGLTLDEIATLERLAPTYPITEAFGATPAVARSAFGRSSTVIPNERVDHLMRMSPPVEEPVLGAGANPVDFIERGCRGGHTVEAVSAFERANPRFAFEEVPAAPSRTAATAGYRRYRQYVWRDPATAPPPLGSPARPGGSAFNAADWIRSNSPKTVTENFQEFLRQAEDAFIQWRTANPTLARSSGVFGSGRQVPGAAPVGGGPAPMVPGPAAMSESGINIGGAFDWEQARGAMPEYWRIRTFWVEETWFN